MNEFKHVYKNPDGSEYHFCNHLTSYAGRCGKVVWSDNIDERCKEHVGKKEATVKTKQITNFNRWERDTIGGKD